ncbi:hypothetical protein BS47DRAFT_400650 [Hydnum rufescens UP504]|uniref:DUF962 domain-containing protein n=1 Tax=Hydnum rufescens UP504 TaxID=1448309 RepID=A0A9P6BCC4_9AGAM|nr:hypothetical protein BS47DRAFT_400650 [Hydnum rufescens UP504]
MLDLFKVDKQLAFYGAYHRNKWNILVHVVFVPVIVWTGGVFFANLTPPAFIPFVSYPINEYLLAETNWATLVASAFLLYYLILEPLGALLFFPQIFLTVLTATAFARHNPSQLSISLALHVLSWIAQFVSHTVAEKRAPALLDNILGATVLAPFFVHLENLFFLGYKPDLHRRIQNLVGVEIARIKGLEGKKRRQAATPAVGSVGGEKSKSQ